MALLLLSGSALADSPVVSTQTSSHEVIQNSSDSSATSSTQVQVTSSDQSGDQAISKTTVSGNGVPPDASKATEPNTGSTSIVVESSVDTSASGANLAGAAMVNGSLSAIDHDSTVVALAATNNEPSLATSRGFAHGLAAQVSHFSSIYGQDTAAEPVAIPATSPLPEKAPFKPTGLLNQLTSNLAALVAPSTVKFYEMTPYGMRALGIVAVITLLFSVLFVRSYGQSMRRFGFVYAARSDLPASNFAPPYLLGYVPVSGRVT